MLTWGLSLVKAAAYVLAPNLSWPKTLLTGFTRAGPTTCLEVRRRVVREREKAIATPEEEQ